jgi:hypothetical protein
MALSGHTWRSHPFNAGENHKCLSSFSEGGKFIAGKIYQLIRVDHSHYDECTIFTFKSQETGEAFEWWWSDRDLESLCHARFQLHT